MGNDAALLALARERAPLQVRLAAVHALADEAALKTAEVMLRDDDRRVHRLARQRHALAVAQRKVRAQATLVIEGASALALQALVPVNRLVELGAAWSALDPALLDPAQRAQYEGLMAQLAAVARERADLPLNIRRWTEQARAALADLRRACTEAAAGTRGRAELAAAGAAARAVAAAAAHEAQGSAVHDDLLRMEDLRRRLDECLARADDAAPPWTQPATLGDAELDAVLQQRALRSQQARDEQEAARLEQRRERQRARQQAVHEERARLLAQALDLAEGALAAGHLGHMHDHMLEIDRLSSGSAAAAQRGRIDALKAHHARLLGWQQWSGGRARDELLQQAEALAAATLQPKTTPGTPGKPSKPGKPASLTTRQLAEVIDDMRARWKELDRLGGATNKTLWQRFDSALKTAYKPVSEQVAAQRAAREQNLQARTQLLEQLEAVTVPPIEEGSAPPDGRALASALDRFRTAWRKLGPVEHTVPHAERDGLLQRMNAATLRLETPLQEAWREARREREALVARAKALVTEAAGRDLGPKARDLQAQWQQRAQSSPLGRTDEQALWTDFKAAIDAAFGAREAAFNARDAEFRAHGAERTALIERLQALSADTPVAQLERTLAAVDASWRRAGPAPRSDAAALDARFHRARDDVLRWVATSARRRWQAQCDALLAKLALCEELERSADAAAARLDIAPRWSGLPALPELLEQALARRAGLVQAAARGGVAPITPSITASSDELLLQLEAAWGVESPPAFESARHALKLQAMKAALETRRPAGPPPTPGQWLAELLRRPGLEAVQRERLQAVLAALGRRGSIDAG